MADLISVIIPVYNHASELLACLEALEDQTYRNTEVVIVDDASLEPVATVLEGKTYAFPYQLIRLPTNQDAPHARNVGFARSGGKLVIFLDADIVLRPHALEMMASALHKDPTASFAYASFYFGWKKFRGQPFDRAALLRRNDIHTSSLMRREAFPGFDPQFKKFQDWDLWLTMTQRGEHGVWIDEPLFTVAPRRSGKSHWLPRMAYAVPWPILGYTPARIRRYREAETLIRKKHPLGEHGDKGQPLRVDLFWLWMSMILALECLSALAIFSPQWNTFFALCVASILCVIATFRPLWALTFLSAEYIIGSKGGLLKYGADATNNGGINVRVLLFGAFMVGWLVNVFWTKSWKSWASFLVERWIYLLLAGMLAYAFIRGWVLGQHTFLLADANGWGMWLLLLSVLDIAATKARCWREILIPGLLAASVWMLVETMVLFYFFSHGFFDALGPVYYWIRRTGVGEMTKVLPDAAVYRIFFQSHLYAVVIVLAGFVTSLYGVARMRWMLGVRLLALAVVLVSLSRSLWIGLAAGYLFTIIYAFLSLRSQKDKGPYFWKQTLLTEIGLGTAAMLLVVFVAILPWPPAQPASLRQVIESRADIQEDAAKSRWKLLPVLQAKIQKHPILGSGFGSTVTYQTHDPRLVASQQRTYTTFTVEWGWHEFWVKFGVIGIPLMAAVLLLLFRRVSRSTLPPWFVAVTAGTLAALAVTHVFTPYLNHPLGFFIILLVEGILMGSTRWRKRLSPEVLSV